jgi:ketopantoate hydroxymethyltransferase
MVVVMRVRLLSLGSAKGRTPTGAVFVVLDVVVLQLPALVTGSIVAAALGIGCYVWRCMLQIVTPP